MRSSKGPSVRWRNYLNTGFQFPVGFPPSGFFGRKTCAAPPFASARPLVAAAHCQGLWGLSTGLPPSGHETTAIATNGQADFTMFEYSTLDGTADARLRAFLATEVDSRETAAIRSSARDPDTVPVHRRDSDPAYELNCVDSAGSDRALCAFQSSRRYGIWRSDGYPDCDEIIIVQSWLASSPEGFTLLQANTTLTDCDAKELGTVTPLLLIGASARTFVVTREHGYEDESFAVLEVRASQLHRQLEIPGGGC